MSRGLVESILPEITDRSIPIDWNAKDSAAEFRGVDVAWRNVTNQRLRILWIARKKTSKSGARTDLGTQETTWEQWCSDAEVDKRKANRWLAAYDVLLDHKGEQKKQQPRVKPPEVKVYPPGQGPQPPEPRVIDDTTQLLQDEASRARASESLVTSNSDAVTSDAVTSNITGHYETPVSSSGIESFAEPHDSREIRIEVSGGIDYPKHLEMVLSDLITPPEDVTEEQAAACVKMLGKIKNRASHIVRKLKQAYGEERPEDEQDMWNRLRDAFATKQGFPLDYRLESKPMWTLVDFAKQTDNPIDFLGTLINGYWTLTDSDDKFWSGQPFMPSALASPGIFHRVIKHIDNGVSRELTPEQEELVAGMKL